MADHPVSPTVCALACACESAMKTRNYNSVATWQSIENKFKAAFGGKAPYSWQIDWWGWRWGGRTLECWFTRICWLQWLGESAGGSMLFLIVLLYQIQMIALDLLKTATGGNLGSTPRSSVLISSLLHLYLGTQPYVWFWWGGWVLCGFHRC